MTQQLSPVFNDAQLDGNGNPLVGGRLFSWLTGSMTKVTVFANSAGSSNHTNPIILNSRGEPPSPIYLPTVTTIRFGLAPANDLGDPPSVLIRDIDGVVDSSSTLLNEWVASNLGPTFLTTTTFTVPGDQTTQIHRGRRIRSQNTSGTVFSTVSSSVFTTLTTVVVVNDSEVGLDAGLVSFDIGIISAVSTSLPAILLSEWVPLVLVPTFVSATSFTVLGDQTAILHARRRLMTINTAGAVFSTILTSVFGVVTTVTLANDSGALDAGLRFVSYGITSHVNTSAPQKFIDFQVFTDNGVWTKPVGTRSAYVIVCSGGDAGGGMALTAAGQAAGGSGGNSGSIAERFITSGLGVTEAVTVGVGGAVGGAGANGGAGAATSFGAHVSSVAGVGGNAGAALASDRPNVHPPPPNIPVTGQINIPQQIAGYGFSSASGAAGTGGDGADGRYGSGGRGATSGGTSPGVIGLGFGSGGSGGSNGPSQIAGTGTAGRPGICIVTSYA